MKSSAIYCPNCHSLNALGRKHCHTCGADLTNAPVVSESNNSEERTFRIGEYTYKSGSNIWITGLKTFGYSFLFILLVAGACLGVIISKNTYSSGMGFLVFVIFAIAAFLLVAALMVFLNIAENISETKNLTEKIASIYCAEHLAGKNLSINEPAGFDDESDISAPTETLCSNCGCKIDDANQTYCANCGNEVKNPL